MLSSFAVCVYSRRPVRFPLASVSFFTENLNPRPLPFLPLPSNQAADECMPSYPLFCASYRPSPLCTALPEFENVVAAAVAAGAVTSNWPAGKARQAIGRPAGRLRSLCRSLGRADGRQSGEVAFACTNDGRCGSSSGQ